MKLYVRIDNGGVFRFIEYEGMSQDAIANLLQGKNFTFVDEQTYLANCE